LGTSTTRPQTAKAAGRHGSDRCGALIPLHFPFAYDAPVDITNPSTPITGASTSHNSVERSPDEAPTPPSFAPWMDTARRGASEVLAEVKQHKRETEMLEKVIRDTVREESSRLEARLELLEQSSRPIARTCQTQTRQPSHSLRNDEGSTGPTKEESKFLLHGETSSSLLMANLEIPVHDPVLRSKVAKCASKDY